MVKWWSVESRSPADRHIKKSDHNENYKLYAVVAPSISSQFSYAKLGQVITGIQELGLFHVVEAALGADMVSYACLLYTSGKGGIGHAPHSADRQCGGKGGNAVL